MLATKLNTTPTCELVNKQPASYLCSRLERLHRVPTASEEPIVFRDLLAPWNACSQSRLAIVVAERSVSSHLLSTICTCSCFTACDFQTRSADLDGNLSVAKDNIRCPAASLGRYDHHFLRQGRRHVNHTILRPHLDG